MYKIIGGDQQEYGPVTVDELRRWIAEGRANADTLVQAEGSDQWLPLRSYPELAVHLPPQPQPPPGFTSAENIDFSTALAREYSIDAGDCVSRGWRLFTNQFGILFGAGAIFLLINLALSGTSQVEFLGTLSSIINFIVAGPLIGGLCFLYLKAVRGREPSLEDLFAGFRFAFLQLFLAYLIITLLVVLSAAPGSLLIGLGIFLAAQQGSGLGFILVIAGALLAAAPALALIVLWVFSFPLIIDKGLGFWAAMETSRKMVGKHPGQILLLLIVLMFIYIAGVLLCCVGLFFTMPIAVGALMIAYEEIFGTNPVPAL